MNRFYISVVFFSTILSLTAQAQGKVNQLTGQQLYQKYCVACHQSDGGGVPRMTPPLFGTDYTTGDKKRLISILLKGFLAINNTSFVRGHCYVRIRNPLDE